MPFNVTTTITRPRYRSVAVMTNLRATIGREGDIAVLHGYTSPGDGGGRSYFWDPDSTTGDNGGTIIVPNPSSRGRWVAVPNSTMLSVRDFGAKGDGTTNDYAAIWECIKRATNYGASTSKPGAVYFPVGTYALETPIVYVGRGEALNLIGEAGGMMAWGGSVLKWNGALDATMLEHTGTWRGVMSHLDFDANSRARTAIWTHSGQATGGTGVQGYLFDHVGAYDVYAAGTDPVVHRIGDAIGGTYQVDLSRWEHCQYRGSTSTPQNVTLWRQEQGGNTCNFAFVGGQFMNGRYGIDALNGSGPISITDVFFAAIGDGATGADAACMRFGGATRVSVRSTNCENELKARFITGTMGSSGANGLHVESCMVEMESPADNAVISYGGPLTLKNNVFGGAVTNIATITPKIVAAALRLSFDGASGQTPGVVISEGNYYGYANQGSYAPIFDGQGNAMTGPDSYGPGGYYGYFRTQTRSSADTATKTGTAVAITLEPWDGSIARSSVAWDPASCAAGTTVTLAHTWAVAGVIAGCDEISAQWSGYLPAGVLLSAGRSGADAVWAALTNTTGSSVDIAAGSVLFTARKAG